MPSAFPHSLLDTSVAIMWLCRSTRRINLLTSPSSLTVHLPKDKGDLIGHTLGSLPGVANTALLPWPHGLLGGHLGGCAGGLLEGDFSYELGVSWLHVTFA